MAERLQRNSFIEYYIHHDARLASALTVVQRIPIEVRNYDPHYVAHTANEMQSAVANELKVGTYRVVSEVQVGHFFVVLEGEEHVAAIMRHGGQQLLDGIGESERERKIRMMQRKSNRDNLLTSLSIVETIGASFVWDAVSRRTGIPLELETSANLRSLQVAVIMAAMANDLPVRVNSHFDCPNYPDTFTEEQEGLLNLDGSISWQEHVIDPVMGRGTYAQVTNDTIAWIREKLAKLAPSLSVVVTHTQQTNAADLFAGEEPTRYDELKARFFLKGKPSFVLGVHTS